MKARYWTLYRKVGSAGRAYITSSTSFKRIQESARRQAARATGPLVIVPSNPRMAPIDYQAPQTDLFESILDREVESL